MAGLPEVFRDWFAEKGWSPHPHQLDMLRAATAGKHTLLIAPTGGGKTLSGFLPSLIGLADAPYDGLHTLYISPLKALAVDIHRNLTLPIEEMGLPVTVETRTGKEAAPARQPAQYPPDHTGKPCPAAFLR